MIPKHTLAFIAATSLMVTPVISKDCLITFPNLGYGEPAKFEVSFNEAFHIQVDGKTCTIWLWQCTVRNTDLPEHVVFEVTEVSDMHRDDLQDIGNI